MRQNLILPTLFAVVVVSSLACPVLGQEVSDKEIWRSGIGDPVVAVALSQDGLYGVVTTEERVYLYDQNGTILWRYPVSHSRSVAISSDSERIVAGGDHLLLFDRKGNVIWRYKPESRIQGIAVTTDGCTICAAIDTGLRIFSLDDGRTTANASWSFDTGDPIKSVSIDGGGSNIAAGGDSGNVYFLSGDGRLLWTYRTGNNGIKVAVSHDGSTVAAASHQRVVLLLNRNGRLLWKSPMPRQITDVSISRDGSTLVLASGGIFMFNRSGEITWAYATQEDIRSVSTPSDTMRILTGTFDGTVSVFMAQPETFSAETPDNLPLNVAFTAESSQPTVAPTQGQTTSQQGMALPPATPVTVGACVAALAWWRRQKR